MSGRIGEDNRIKIDILAPTSAASKTSKYIDMCVCERVCFAVGMGAVGANNSITAKLVQSGDKLGTTSADVTGASTILGSTAANTVTKAKSVLITISSAATDAETLVINGSTFTCSTAGGNATAYARALVFGSTAGTTAAGGIDAIAHSLAAVINTNLTNLTAATASTATVQINVNDGVSTFINVTGGATLSPSYLQAMALIEINAEQLNSTSRYCAVTLTTAATALTMGVCAIGSGLRQGPGTLVGPYHKTT